MSRIVVVATAPLEPGVLDATIDPGDDLHVVVAAVEQSHLQWLANDEGEARDTAERAGEEIADAAPTDTATVDVKPERPTQLVLDAIREHQPDRVVVALRDGEDASWLEDGELGNVPGQVAGVPVTRIAV